jgi:hypothetical protein
MFPASRRRGVNLIAENGGLMRQVLSKHAATFSTGKVLIVS